MLVLNGTEFLIHFRIFNRHDISETRARDSSENPFLAVTPQAELIETNLFDSQKRLKRIARPIGGAMKLITNYE